MEHKEYNEIKDAFKNLYKGEVNDRKKRRVITKIKETGYLEKFIEENNISTNLETIVKEFVRLMNKPKNQKYPNTIRFNLYTFNDLPRCFLRHYYELGAYFCENKQLEKEDFKTFSRFDWFFKKACQRYNIEPYASMDEAELYALLNDYLCMQRKKIGNPCLKYPVEAQDINQIAEEKTYERFNRRTTYLLSKYGDGFGYKINYKDKSNEKEYLIEVKASKNKTSFNLSRYEHKLMYETADLPNTEYLIYKYCFTTDPETNEDIVKFLDIYRYDKKRNILVDVYDENHICLIRPYFDYERDYGRQRVRFSCEPKWLSKERTLTMAKQDCYKKRNNKNTNN